MKKVAMLIFCASVITYVGCSHTIPPAATTPQPPPRLGSTPPVAPPVSASVKQAQAPESVLPVNLTVDLSPLSRIIQAAFPERIMETGHPLGRDYKWLFIRDGNPQVRIQDGVVTYHADYRGHIESSAARACRLDPLYPVIEGTGRLSLREQAQGLLVTMVDPRTTIELKPESDRSCNMFNIPVKDQLAELFNQEAINQQITQSLNQASYSIPLNLVQDRLQQPIPVTQGDTNFCLYGRAREFTLGTLKGSAQHTSISGVAKQTPFALYHTPCRQPSDSSPMKVHIDQSVTAAQGGQPYKILLTVPVPYDVLNRQLQERLFHQQVNLPTMFGGNVLIEQVSASNVNGQTLLTIDTSGNINGTLYYWGVPHFERGGNVISFSALQMAPETKSALDNVKLGYWEVVDRELKARLQEAAAIDLSPQLRNIKTALSGPHKSGWLELDLSMAHLEPAQVTSRKKALVADVVLEGTASATGQLPIAQQMQEPSKPQPNQSSRAAHVQDEETLEEFWEGQ